MTKLTIDEAKRIIMQGREQLTAAEQRIEQLERLCRDLLLHSVAGASTSYDKRKWYEELEILTERMDALGLLEDDHDS